MNISLFPKNEQWLTGEESSDVRLTRALHQTLNSLSLESIKNFEILARQIKPRIGEAQFIQNVNFTLKALIGLMNPDGFINHEWQKYLGNYHLKEKVMINSLSLIALEKELLSRKYIRLQGELDLKILENKESEFNPFLDFKLKLSKEEFSVRVIFKEFKDKIRKKEFTKREDQSEIFYLLQNENCVYQFPEGLTIWSDRLEIYAFL